MNVRIEELSSIARKLHFEVGAERVDEEIERAFRKIGKTAKIKGFRPGKIPQSVLEKYYGGQMEKEVLGRMTPPEPAWGRARESMGTDQKQGLTILDGLAVPRLAHGDRAARVRAGGVRHPHRLDGADADGLLQAGDRGDPLPRPIVRQEARGEVAARNAPSSLPTGPSIHTVRASLMSALNRAALAAGTFGPLSNQMVDSGAIEPDGVLLERIRMKPMRTLSGVTTVTVLTKPYPCPGKCIFCPTDVRMPKSYLPDEPGAMRALEHQFDPYQQVEARIQALKNLGHPTDKIELLILGGTWSAYRRDYQEWFVQRCLEALKRVLKL